MATSKSVNAYLNFDGRCEEAVEFYCRALGAEVESIMRMKDSPDPGQCAPGAGEKIMHASFRIGGSSIMASDCRSTGKPDFQGFSLALGVATEAEAEQYFAALSEGGAVEMPLEKTFWSPRFGVVTDRFGVSWMVNVVVAASGK